MFVAGEVSVTTEEGSEKKWLSQLSANRPATTRPDYDLERQQERRRRIRYRKRARCPKADVHSNRIAYWLIGGLFVLLLFGCMTTSAASLFLISYPVSRSPAQQPEATPEAIRAAIPTPRPLVIVAAPEGGIDYENAVFANLYDQVNPSVVNVTLLSTGESLSESIPHAMVPGSLDPEGLLQSQFRLGLRLGFIWPYRDQQPCG